MDRRRAIGRWARFVVGLLILGAAIAILRSDVHASLSAAAMRQAMLDLGPWGPVVFLAAFALLQPFGLSAHVFIVAAALVWGPALGMLLSWIGCLLASACAYWFARWMGRAWVAARLPERLRRFDDRLAHDGFRTVLVLRLLFFTFGPMQLMLGVSQVGFFAFIAGSALGLAPMIALESIVGSSLVAWLFG